MLKNLCCPTCHQESFTVAIAYNRVIVDCCECDTRMSIPVKEYDKGAYFKTTWDYIEYSDECNVRE